ncbi:MAG: hypothetical protein AB7F91_10850 [Parvularculaceae bacterium]|nr:hypothetical protein [Parvularculaceae bacterium]
MLNTDRVAIPAQVEVRLKRSAQFVDNIMDFAREDLIGFRRPLAATFAFTAPLVMAFVYHSGGLTHLLQVGASYLIVGFGGLYLVGRQAWPRLVDQFEAKSVEKRRAIADLKCGFSELSFLNLSRAPRYFEHDNGVLVFADAGDFRTLFFSIDNSNRNSGRDDRWNLYINGELDRRVWRWLRLPVSRDIVKFSTEASKLPTVHSDPQRIRSVDAWEAINVSLGEPLDGSIIHRPFDEVVESVERML